eukprot:FR739597.1.p2 GENE.FR739597.1~~FR739597.1.p2  ORF type:complete len:107 (+),score=10.58 FR739597.1:29-322(+)
MTEKYGVPQEEKSPDDDAISVARSLLSTTDLNKVHSQKSVAAIAVRNKDSGLGTVAEGGEQAIAQPKMIQHTDDDGARLQNKTEVHNLPYMNRNPSV